MNRRQFIRTGAAGLGAAALGFGQAGSSKPLRVGLIGCGWYGKCDLFRLIQVSPVEVVSLCDVDRRMLSEAADLVTSAPGLPQEAAHLQRLSQDARREGSRYRPDRHARSLACPAHDRRREGRRRRLLPEADQRGRGGGPGDARRRPQIQSRRADRHAAAQHAAPDRSARPDREARANSARSGWWKSTVTTTCATRAIRPIAHRRTISTTNMWTGPAPMRPYNPIVHPRGWRAFMEYGNGIVGDMCVHMLDMTRWMLDLGWPKRIESSGGILVSQGQQGEHHRHAARDIRLSAISKWSGSIAPGEPNPTRSIPGAPPSTATRVRSRQA